MIPIPWSALLFNRFTAAALALVLAAAAYLWWSSSIKREALEAERLRIEHQAEMQRTANRSRSRDAEQRHAATSTYRDRYITRTITKIRYVTQNLAACTLSPDAIRMLNDVAKCAEDDRPASCASGDPVQPPG